MQEDIRFTLFIIGIAVIGGVLLHGIWTIRKNSKKSTRASFESKNWEPGFEHEDDLDADVPLYDDVGVGKARVVFNPKSEQKESDMPFVEPIEQSETSESLNKVDTELSDENAFKQNVGAGQIGEGEDFAPVAGEYTSNDAEHEKQEPAKPIAQASEFEPSDQSDKVDGVNDSTVLNENVSDTESSQQDSAQTEVKSEVKVAPMYSNVVTQPKPEFHKPSIAKDILSEDIGQPPEFLLKKQSDESALEPTPADIDQEESDKPIEPAQSEQTKPAQTAPTVEPIYETPLYSGDEKAPEFSLNIQEGPQAPVKDPNKPGVEKELSFAEQAKRFVRRNKKSVSDKLRKEPVIKDSEEDQMRIDFDRKESKPIVREEQLDLIGHDDHHHIEDKPKEPIVEKEAYTGDPVVLVLNVKADKNSPIEGAALLPMLLTLGFKFGEHEIFHRHVNTNGKGPILFSLANMLKPGNFDIDNIENFSTLGLSLFMMLPIDGDAQQVFNMMHNAARKLSEEFDCRILDGNKVVLSKQSVQQYVERIREFERKRLSR
ncbi:cell division protein ZipA [Glaciecola sp. 2405UD65-10]|uniref:cell division protein ZipA n=1 Tax=Glaciecola sp. 2405UD65-10 TaxID=3397244 RepID=UPI003B5AC1D3